MSVASTLQRFALLTAAAVTLGACKDDKPLAQLPLAPIDIGPDALSAYLTVSNAAPSAGSEVTVAVHARRGSLVGPIGSFTLRVGYDSTMLKFKDAARSTYGMVMTNATKGGAVVAAGASAQGFTDDQLLAATFTVLHGGADAMKSLALTVSELNSIKFEDQKAKMRVERALYREASPTK